MDIVNTAVGPEGKLAVSSEGGKIKLTFTHAHASGEVSISVVEDEKYFLELLKPHLPAVIQPVVAAVEAVLP